MIDHSKTSLIVSFGLFIWIVFYLYKDKMLHFIDQHIQNTQEKINTVSNLKDENLKELQLEKDRLGTLEQELHKIELDARNTIDKYANDLKEKTKHFLALKRNELSSNMETMEKDFEEKLQSRLIEVALQKAQESIQQMPAEYTQHFLEYHLEETLKKQL